MKMQVLTLNQKEAAKAIGVHADTLRSWHNTGKGPAYIETPSGRIRYPVAELEKFTKPQTQAA